MVSGLVGLVNCWLSDELVVLSVNFWLVSVLVCLSAVGWYIAWVSVSCQSDICGLVGVLGLVNHNCHVFNNLYTVFSGK